MDKDAKASKRRPEEGKADETVRKEQPGAGKPNEADARDDAKQLKENQQRLGVGPEHKTDSMKKGGRGTFP